MPDLSASFNVDDLLNSQYGKVHASGRLNIDTLKAYSKPLGMDVFITNAAFSVDSTQLSSSYLENKDLLSITLSVDSLNVKYQDDISTNISRLAIQAKTSPVIDTTAVHPNDSTVEIRLSAHPSS